MNDEKLMQASAGLLVFAGVLVVLGQLLAGTSLGQVTPSENFGAWVAVLVGGMVVALAVTVVALRIGKTLGRRPAPNAQQSNVNAATPAAKPQPAKQATRRIYNYEELQW